MFEKTSLLYICTTLEAIEKIEIYSGSFQNGQELREANDQMNFNAISRLLLAIGEETKKIEEPLLNLQPQINWISIVGLRNRMAHDYRGIDADIIFDIVKVELLPLKNALLLYLLRHFSIPRKDLKDLVTSSYFKHIGYVSTYLQIID
jgi:uncharacterized protein with HEPN domain